MTSHRIALKESSSSQKFDQATDYDACEGNRSDTDVKLLKVSGPDGHQYELHGPFEHCDEIYTKIKSYFEGVRQLEVYQGESDICNLSVKDVKGPLSVFIKDASVLCYMASGLEIELHGPFEHCDQIYAKIDAHFNYMCQFEVLQGDYEVHQVPVKDITGPLTLTKTARLGVEVSNTPCGTLQLQGLFRDLGEVCGRVDRETGGLYRFALCRDGEEQVSKLDLNSPITFLKHGWSPCQFYPREESDIDRLKDMQVRKKDSLPSGKGWQEYRMARDIPGISYRMEYSESAEVKFHCMCGDSYSRISDEDYRKGGKYGEEFRKARGKTIWAHGKAFGTDVAKELLENGRGTDLCIHRIAELLMPTLTKFKDAFGNEKGRDSLGYDKGKGKDSFGYEMVKGKGRDSFGYDKGKGKGRGKSKDSFEYEMVKGKDFLAYGKDEGKGKGKISFGCDEGKGENSFEDNKGKGQPLFAMDFILELQAFARSNGIDKRREGDCLGREYTVKDVLAVCIEDLRYMVVNEKFCRLEYVKGFIHGLEESMP